MRATAPPIAPLPTSTSVFPASSNICLVKKQKSGDAAHAPAFTAAVWPATSCENCSTSAITCCATDAAA